MTQAIIIPVMGENLDENDETFSVDLSDPSNATLADKRGIGTITDDDAAALSIKPRYEVLQIRFRISWKVVKYQET